MQKKEVGNQGGNPPWRKNLFFFSLIIIVVEYWQKKRKKTVLKQNWDWEQGIGTAAGRRAGSFGKADDSCRSFRWFGGGWVGEMALQSQLLLPITNEN